MDTLLDCYRGAYGLTIRFDSVSLDDLRTLREIFRRLSSGEVSAVEIHRLRGLVVTNLKALTLVTVPVKPDVSLRRSDNSTFRWVNTRQGWKKCCDLLDGLVEFNKPGHQYLTSEGIDEALVEVCLYERTDADSRKD